MMKSYNFILYVLMMVAALLPQHSFAQMRIPTLPEQQALCSKTGGKWETLPVFCDEMQPRSWGKLDDNQRMICQDKFNEPCECGMGKRFSIFKGCMVSNFPADNTPDDPSLGTQP
jgi:hypothetical protein